MKYLGIISNDKDLVTKEYVDGKSGVTGVKGSAESSYRTGNVSINATNTGAIPNGSSGNTQMLKRPSYLQGTNDVTIDSKINTLRANRLAFLPADQIIIEQTIDGGETWTDAGVDDATKLALFSETRPYINIPRIDGKKNPLCGLRITITAMKYNVPANTPETQKYNYWNSNYVLSTERYNQLKEMYFWVSVSGGAINVKIERATGKNPNSWVIAFDNDSFNMTGYSGNDYLSFSQGVFGGGTTQVNNYWNYRITFKTDDIIPASPYDGYSQSIYEIRGYGDTWWTAGNEYAANDKMYTHDYLKNVTFPNKVTATGGFSGSLTGTATGLTNFKVTTTTNLGIDAPGTNAIGYVSGLTKANWNYQQTDGSLYTQWYNSSWIHEIFGDYRTGQISVRGKNSGTWQSWRRVLDESNWSNFITIPTVPSATNSATTGISIAAHGTGTVIGVQSTTTTASKASGANGTAPTLGTAISLIGVQSSTTTASKVTVGSHSTDYGVKSAGSGSFTSGAFSGGSGSFGATVTNHVLSFSHTHTAATHGADSHTHTAPTLGSKVPTVSASDVTVPIKNASATSIPNVTSAGSASTWSFTDVTVPIKNTSASTFVTGTSHTVTDNGHTHTLS